MTTLEIAQTIKSQIRHTELWAIGAKNFLALNETTGRRGGLQFDASLFGAKRCKVIIELSGKDLYNVRVVTGRSYDKILTQEIDVFCEDLEAVVIEAVEKKFAK